MTRRRSPRNAPARIYAISPSGPIADPTRIERARAYLAQAGFPVQLDRAALSVWQRFAGSDAVRLAAFARAASSDCPIIMATRGGYGLTRIIDQIDFATLAKANKQWVGFSDFTAFQLGMLARAGATTWSSPCLVAGYGVESFDAIDETTLETFVDCMEGRVRVLGFDCRGPRGFECEGILWGGNLSLVCALLGTPFFPEVDGGILFVEDTNEHPYRIERMLLQLLQAGVLDRQQALVFGQFDGYRTQLHDRGFEFEVVVERLRQRLSCAVITGLPFGHGSPCLTLPHGAHIGLTISRGTCYLVLEHDHDHHHQGPA